MQISIIVTHMSVFVKGYGPIIVTIVHVEQNWKGRDIQMSVLCFCWCHTIKSIMLVSLVPSGEVPGSSRI